MKIGSPDWGLGVLADKKIERKPYLFWAFGVMSMYLFRPKLLHY